MAKDGRKVAVVIGVGVVIAGLISLATRAKAAPLDITISPTSFPTRGEKPSSTPITVIITNTSNSPIWRVELLPVSAEGIIITTIPWKTTSEWETEQTGDVEQVDEGWTRYVTMGLRMVAKEGYAIQPGETRDISLGIVGAEVSSGTQWIIECENIEGKRFTSSVVMKTV